MRTIRRPPRRPALRRPALRRTAAALLATAVLGVPASTAAVGGASPHAAAWAARGRPLVLVGWEIAGDRLVDAEDLAAVLPVRGEPITPAAIDARATDLATRLRDAGWWAATVTAVPRIADDDRVRVTLRIDAGTPVEIGEIGVRGNLALAREEILALMDLRPGRIFDAGVFRRDAARILRAYSERGHALARVYPSRFRATGDGRLGFDVRLGEGPGCTIGSVRVFGAQATRPAVVARIAGVRAGDRWDPRRIEGMAPRLRREGLFTRVGEPRIVRGERDARLGVEIEVVEGPQGAFLGVLGWTPDPGGDGGELVGLVDVRLRNILGTARRASLRFDRRAAEVQDIAFRFREPWVLGTPVSLEGGAAQALRDTLYSRTDLDLAVRVPLGARAEARAAIERRDANFDAFDGTSVRETSTGGSVGLAADHRDAPWNPGRGWAADLLVGVRTTTDDVRRTRIELDGQVLVPLGRRWVVSEEVGARGVWSTATDVPVWEQYWLGGTNTLRGYAEERFRGERIWWARTELRYRLTSRSRAYVLVDAGGWEFDTPADPGPVRRLGDDLAGAGVGATLETTGSGLVRVEIAVGRGDGFSDAKVHAALEQEF